MIKILSPDDLAPTLIGSEVENADAATHAFGMRGPNTMIGIAPRQSCQLDQLSIFLQLTFMVNASESQ